MWLESTEEGRRGREAGEEQGWQGWLFEALVWAE